MDAQPQLRGELASLGLVPLARFVASLGTSGDLLVACDTWRARLCFDRGRLTAAVAPGEVGWAAVESVLLGMGAGDFEFRAGPPGLAANLEPADDSQLCAWLEREDVAPPDAVPGPVAVPTLTRGSGGGEHNMVDLDRASLAILLAVDGRADVATLAARYGTLRTLKALARLRTLDLLTFETPAVGVLAATEVSAPPAPEAAPRSKPLRPQGTRLGLRRLASWPAALALLGASVALIPQSVVAVNGQSMAPALASGQLLLVNRAAYAIGAPDRGDVIVFRHASPGFTAEYVVKRVIGLPGDLVQVDTGQVFVNGVRLDEPYVVDPDDYTYPQNGGPLRVPQGAYFVLGDNRPFSADSHLGWFVSIEDVVGQALPLPVAVSARTPLNS